jgi:hypothetical protein
LDGCPPPDAEPLNLDGLAIRLIWRSARVAAIEEVDVHDGLEHQLAGKGVALVILPTDTQERAKATAKLAAMIDGRT